MDTDTPLDSDLFDAPKPKKRVKETLSKSAEVNVNPNATHQIIATVPHTGSALVIPELVEFIRKKVKDWTRISPSGGALKEMPVYSLDDMEEDEWIEHGGILIVNLDRIDDDTNRMVCELFEKSGHRYYIHEAHDRRACEVALLEISTQNNIEHFVWNPTAATPIHDAELHTDHALAVTFCWKEILNAWHRAYPGQYFSVSSVWEYHEYPWPVNIATSTPGDSIGHRGPAHWKNLIQEKTTQRINVDARWLSQYIHKTPQYAK